MSLNARIEFRIADTFTDSLARLTGDEQKLVKTTAFDLQLNPANPGMQFHRLDRPRDKNFWSVRVGSDIRLIVHRTSSSLLLCYADHHDKAYQWAEVALHRAVFLARSHPESRVLLTTFSDTLANAFRTRVWASGALDSVRRPAQAIEGGRVRHERGNVSSSRGAAGRA